MAFPAKKLTDDISVSPQIMPSDIDALKAAGFQTVIINRPDGEAPNQPSAHELGEQLTNAGLNTFNIPMSPGQLTPDLVAQMKEALDTAPKPILAFCASGTRSTVLWCCATVAEQGVDGVLSTAAQAGYDLEQIRPLLNQLSR